MTKAEIQELTRDARYWLQTIDRIVRKPGSLEDLGDLSKRRLMRAATEGAGTIGTIETLFIEEGYDNKEVGR